MTSSRRSCAASAPGIRRGSANAPAPPAARRYARAPTAEPRDTTDSEPDFADYAVDTPGAEES